MIAADMGMDVQVRPIPFREVPDFVEVGACGTAVVLTPVNEIVRAGESIPVGSADGCGPFLAELYSRMTAIQYGEAADIFGWTIVI